MAQTQDGLSETRDGNTRGGEMAQERKAFAFSTIEKDIVQKHISLYKTIAANAWIHLLPYIQDILGQIYKGQCVRILASIAPKIWCKCWE